MIIDKKLYIYIVDNIFIYARNNQFDCILNNYLKRYNFKNIKHKVLFSSKIEKHILTGVKNYYGLGHTTFVDGVLLLTRKGNKIIWK